MIQNRSLKRLVGVYSKKHGPRLDGYLSYFSKLGSLKEAVNLVFFEEDGETIHGHQRRIGRQILVGQAVLALRRSIKQIETCQSFAALHACIKRRTRGIYRFGVLARHDTALRIGARRKLLPEVIYLHAGTKEGCERLGVETTGDTVHITDLPKPIRVLEPHHAENFLCIFKSKFAGEKGSITGCGANGGIC